MKTRYFLIPAVCLACSAAGTDIDGSGGGSATGGQPAAGAGGTATGTGGAATGGTANVGGAAATGGGAVGGGAAAAPIGGAPPTSGIGSGGKSGLQPSDGDGDPKTTCAERSAETEPDPVGILIVLDQSGSMTEFEDRWTPVTDALKAFMGDPSVDDLQVGLQYFPRGAATQSDPAICTAENYGTPDVGIASLSTNVRSLVASIDAHYFTSAEAHDAEHWGTPTKAAVEAGLSTLRAWAAEQPKGRPVLLLATDGEPTSFCTDNDIPSIATVIAEGASGTPAIATYVIGIGEIANLDELATAGDTGQPAFVVSASGGQETRDQFIAALQAIRGLTLACDYPIPDDTEVDENKVNVEHRTAGGDPVVFPRAASLAACPADKPSWYYDDPASPKRVVLCPAACERVNAVEGGVHLVFGCATQIVE
ncbi:MAG TPA: vWA domain-containing protein [Polyangiaceae bacterium]|nr:vWA domain-containing protein [Polyangiaceae bacterium]